ncbi:hypothetical protein LSPH24S_06726 [Lysinibacillus sphaericus]
MNFFSLFHLGGNVEHKAMIAQQVLGKMHQVEDLTWCSYSKHRATCIRKLSQSF